MLYRIVVIVCLVAVLVMAIGCNGGGGGVDRRYSIGVKPSYGWFVIYTDDYIWDPETRCLEVGEHEVRSSMSFGLMREGPTTMYLGEDDRITITDRQE